MYENSGEDTRISASISAVGEKKSQFSGEEFREQFLDGNFEQYNRIIIDLISIHPHVVEKISYIVNHSKKRELILGLPNGLAKILLPDILTMKVLLIHIGG